MDNSGLIQSYDTRATSAAALTQTVMAPQYHQQPYPGPTSLNIMASQQPMHNPFSFSGYSSGEPSNGTIPAFANNYIRQRPQLSQDLIYPGGDRSRGIPYSRGDHRSLEEPQRRSPTAKAEQVQQWNAHVSSPTFASKPTKTITSPLPASAPGIICKTEVDSLMKVIQVKQETSPTCSPVLQSRPVLVAGSPLLSPLHLQHGSQEAAPDGEKEKPSCRPKGSKKRYKCTMEGCSKSFYQKTHLDIHVRAHTGDKPYMCETPGCGFTSSQAGNLKTHERRHTGERPYPCDICGKKFAQRGGVRAHKFIHNAIKPFECRLDNCGKLFTTLGNLKSHQNKFHIATIRTLTSKFSSIKDGDIVSAADKELWEYFAKLYKNSNKGIKGRGKDRKVVPRFPANSSLRSLNSAAFGYSLTGSGRGNMVVGVMDAGMRDHTGSGRGGQQYEMFDTDDCSQAGSHTSGGQSSNGTLYDDAPSDAFEVHGRAGELAFGDRIY